MKSITDPFIHEALGEIQNLSQNEGARWDAFVREQALRDEGSQLAAARIKLAKSLAYLKSPRSSEEL